VENARLRQLFKKHIQDSLPADEAAEMQRYIQDPTYEASFKSIIAGELENEDYNAEPSITEIDIIVDGLEDKVLRSIQKIKPLKVISTSTYWRYASVVAAILMLISSFFYWSDFNLNSTDKAAVIAKENDILPGTNRATLTLDNGKVLSLNGKMEGVEIDGNQLRYENGSVLLENIAGKTFTLSVPKAGKYRVRLADGTQVWLNAASAITYPAQFARAERIVKIQGESYFSVAHDKNHPFLVETAMQTIKVLGTEFNVNTYNQSNTVTTLINGSIALRTIKSNFRSLIPGDQAIVKAGAISISKVDVTDYIAWKDNIIVLDEQDVHEILKQLERWYDIEFINKNDLTKKSLSGEIPRDTPLSSILQALEQQLHVKFIIKGRQVIIKS